MSKDGVVTPESTTLLCVRPDAKSGVLLETLKEDEVFRKMVHQGAVEIVRDRDGKDVYRTPHHYYVLLVRGAGETIEALVEWIRLRLARIHFDVNPGELEWIDRKVIPVIA